ncbi:hypothetical protein BSK66_27695 [Paenibacillus odorifer]|uniref:hypothetical protein n=1 Tax=Paenibacillus TaxID=44249 RepID=UPI0003E28415|nr:MULTISPECIES: hypothetical protein [Paenibacillus]ETT61293.1 hypothetical protein C171_12553 [Paenibacillus sp. FSL H8-237]OMD13741.1 hypothetical protein BJP47_24245 [Paenibacillus odorifer]OME48971.1 hypothetical protein BSK66_27695 [Paenibacillus odorifer]
MDRLFMLIAIVGIAYLALIVFLSTAKQSQRKFYRNKLSLKAVQGRFKSDRLQEMLDKAKIPYSAQAINYFRIVTATAIILIELIGAFLRKTSLSGTDFLIPAAIIYFTTPNRFSPLGWVLAARQRSIDTKKDGELVSFLKQYENNRKRSRGYIDFGTFCEQIAPNFQYLQKDLQELAERSIDDGTEEAILWFCNTFPTNHHFVGDVRSILLATESIQNNEDAVLYLKEQSKTIAKISSDHYQKKWKKIGDHATTFNTLPSLITILMIVVLAIQYVGVVQSNFGEVSLFR